MKSSNYTPHSTDTIIKALQQQKVQHKNALATIKRLQAELNARPSVEQCEILAQQNREAIEARDIAIVNQTHWVSEAERRDSIIMSLEKRIDCLKSIISLHEQEISTLGDAVNKYSAKRLK